MVILGILKGSGILILVVLGLAVGIALLALLAPIKYHVECDNQDNFLIGYSLSWLMRTVRWKKGKYEPDPRLYIFGVPLQSYQRLCRHIKGVVIGEEIGPEEYVDRHVEQSEVELVDDFYEGTKKEEQLVKKSLQTDYEEPKEEKTEKPSKKSFSFERISSIITFVRDNDNKTGMGKIKKELSALIRYLKPTKIRGRLIFGTGDPCTTGWILGVLSMFPAVYADGVTVQPDFEEKIFDANGFIKGKLRLFYFLRLFLRGYMDEDIKRVLRRASRQFKAS